MEFLTPISMTHENPRRGAMLVSRQQHEHANVIGWLLLFSLPSPLFYSVLSVVLLQSQLHTGR
jgi:hypothetical protein